MWEMWVGGFLLLGTIVGGRGVILCLGVACGFWEKCLENPRIMYLLLRGVLKLRVLSGVRVPNLRTCGMR